MPIPVQAPGGEGKGTGERGREGRMPQSQRPGFKATFGPIARRIWDTLLNFLHLIFLFSSYQAPNSLLFTSRLMSLGV